MPAGLHFACFISYVHGEADLGPSFVAQFYRALKNELELLIDLRERPIFSDGDLSPGDRWPVTLSQALCRSVCMVLIFNPVYGRRRECLREYEAMLAVEERRRQLLADAGQAKGFIIPVVLRGFDKLPPHIRDERQAEDFSHFTLAETPMHENSRFIDKVRRIAERIRDHLELLEPLEGVACEGCDRFELPEPTAVRQWASTPATFPGR